MLTPTPTLNTIQWSIDHSMLTHSLAASVDGQVEEFGAGDRHEDTAIEIFTSYVF